MDHSGIVHINLSSSSNSYDSSDAATAAESINSSSATTPTTTTTATTNEPGSHSKNSSMKSNHAKWNLRRGGGAAGERNSNNSTSSNSSCFAIRKCWLIFLVASFFTGIIIVRSNFAQTDIMRQQQQHSQHRFGPFATSSHMESKNKDDASTSTTHEPPFWLMPPQNSSTLTTTNAANVHSHKLQKKGPTATATTTSTSALGSIAKPGSIFRRYKNFRASDRDDEENGNNKNNPFVGPDGRYRKKRKNTRKQKNQQVLQKRLEQQQQELQNQFQRRRKDDEELPKPLPFLFTPAAVPLHAADALLCRESVVNFVINATDGKDECEGLKKAFDKTCGSNSGGGRGGGGAEPASTAAAVGPSQRQRQRRRRLVEKLESQEQRRPWRLYWYQSVRQVHEALQYLYYAGSVPNAFDKDFFFADEEILGPAWETAQYMVQNNIDLLVHEDLTRQWQEENARQEARRRRWYHHHHHRRMQEAKTSTIDEAPEEAGPAANAGTTPADDNNNNSNTTKAVPPALPAINLELPTFDKHASETVVQEALILQQGDKIIEKAANQSKAAQEAAASSKALSDTTAAVSALLNDPSSVEARTCCASILNVYHDNCSHDDEEQISDSRLFFVVVVMALCGMTKSLIRHFKILWLPEAAGCILVGVFSGYLLLLSPRHHDLSFDGNWFLRIMVPPIIFEAALGIDKKSFKRHIVPILFYAFFGTLMATLLTALVVFHGSHMLSGWCTPIPFIEAMTFGALISSIDPIAVLSVLSNMGMNDKDSIYVVIFGESLLNDGIAIVLFDTLVHFLDENLIIDAEALSLAAVHFSVVALGSLLIGIASGMLSTVYFWLFDGCQTALVEVLMFFCWALLPYYVCDGIGWSGIVAAVAVGFVMDIYIVGQKPEDLVIDSSETSDRGYSTPNKRGEVRERRRIFGSPVGHLSVEARTHIHFVAEIVATAMETAIFAYLGLFLFSHRYHWNVWHTIIAILACCLSRAIMIPSLSFLANGVTRIQQRTRSVWGPQQQQQQPGRQHASPMNQYDPHHRGPNNSLASPAGVVINPKMQIVMWFGGLRGAMSFALVEHIPLYDSVSGEGTPLKPELKAMTSATILFTVFVLGGYTYYVMERLGMAPSSSSAPRKQSTPETELASLLSKDRNGGSGESNHHHDNYEDDAQHLHNTIASSRDAAMPNSTTPTKRAVMALPGNRRRQRVTVMENGNS